MTTYIWRWARSMRTLLRQSASPQAISAGLHNDPEHIKWLDKVRKGLN